MYKPIHNNDSSHSRSLWMEVSMPSFPQLQGNLNVDVCIVGAGIAGLTCAYTLSKQGKSVAVIDQGMIGNGQTVRTTAHLSWALEDRYYNLEKFFGEKNTRLIAQSHSAAIDYIEKIVTEENIDCDFQRVGGYLFAAPEDSQDILEKELASIKKTGMPIHKMDQSPFSFFNTGPCLHFPAQAQLHIRKYLAGVVKAITRQKGQVFAHTHANFFEDGVPCRVKTKTGNEILADSVIIATCSPVNDRFYIHTKQAAYRTYVICAKVPKGSIPHGLYWNTADPYHYIRLHPHSTDPAIEWLIVGGEDHKTGQDKNPGANYRHLEKWASKRFPMMGAIEYQWSGQVFEPIDSLAFIGKNPGDQNFYISTGDSGNGITHGTIAGMLLPDLITGSINPWESVYHPSRKTLSAAREFIEENLNTASQYRDWFTPGENRSMDSLGPDDGIILRDGLKKIAVYKDTQNNIHTYSAFCPHLGGCVRWNSSEKCWDCPCHGSQFDGYGNVMCGPAVSNLPELSL